MACLEIPPLQTGLPALLLREISDKDGNDYDKCDTYFRRPEPQELASVTLLYFAPPLGTLQLFIVVVFISTAMSILSRAFIIYPCTALKIIRLSR